MIYLCSFVLMLPIIWQILLATNLEKGFKQGKIWQIRIAYLVITFIGAHLIAIMFDTFVNYLHSLF